MQRVSLFRLVVSAAAVALALIGYSACFIDECDDGICVPETATTGAGVGGDGGDGGAGAAGGGGGAVGGGGGVAAGGSGGS